MTAAQEYIVQQGAYTWSLIPGQSNANAMPQLLSKTTCAQQMEANGCGGEYVAHGEADGPPLLWGITPGPSSDPFPQLTQDVAAFLLLRGPHAFIG
jgi:hypothetical protein